MPSISGATFTCPDPAVTSRNSLSGQMIFLTLPEESSLIGISPTSNWKTKGRYTLPASLIASLNTRSWVVPEDLSNITSNITSLVLYLFNTVRSVACHSLRQGHLPMISMLSSAISMNTTSSVVGRLDLNLNRWSKVTSSNFSRAL